MTNKIESIYFSKQLFNRVSPGLLLVIIIAVIYIYFMKFLDHSLSWVPYVVVLFALLKTIYFTFSTFRQVNKSIRQCHSFMQLLWVFGILVFLIIFSFAADFTCLSAANATSFLELKTSRNLSYSGHLFGYFYFSVVTFASIGYGDIVPVTVPARLIVILEIAQSFVMVVFGLSNINNIHTTFKNK